MERHSIIIQFPSDAEHQFRNLGEGLYRTFLSRREATVFLDDVDRATDHLVIQVRSKSAIRSVRETVEALLEQHHLRALATISVVPDASI